MRIAAYARYSSDNQREASLDDQLRNCRNYCDRQGWPAPEVFTDAAMSGARSDRPGYLALLAVASQFEVVLFDDLSRLSRDSAEVAMAVRRLKFAGVRLIGVSDGVDTARKSHKADVGLRGLMSELYLDDLAEKTHRGLTGRALAGASAGGLPYGYRVTEVGQRAIDPVQGDIVRRIFAEYVSGQSARRIVAQLNLERVPSARGSTWCTSAVFGDVRRGIGILVNPMYVGRQIWNRSRWVKHPETGRRVRQERPEAEWVITEQPALAIIDEATWNAAQARVRGARPNRKGDAKGAGPGRPNKHLLSGILRCGECGGPMVIVDRYRYGCATHKERGDSVCPSLIKVRRDVADTALLAGLQAELLSEAAFQRFQRVVTVELKRAAPDIDAARRKLVDAERVHANILAALRAGIITASTKAELLSAEAAVATSKADLEALKNFQPAQFLPRARETWRRIVEQLADVRDVPAARGALQELLGDSLTVKNENGAIYVEIAPSSSEINLVAGAGFEPATFGL